MRLWDITHPLSNTTAAWPGDTPYQFRLSWQIKEGSSVNVGHVTLSPHNGTHADAPFHYDDQGATMEQVNLSRYIGPALVVGLEGRTLIERADLLALDLVGVERLLVRTGSCPDLNHFHPDFTAFAPEAIQYLAEQGIRLIGTDAHSVDPAESKELPAHHACRTAGILIVENLNLAGVPEGRYELIALPLKLAGADASPIRAILRG
ncbi:MAG TPA: arylformamidase [Symbiobacteriaceae bacterium]|nr:arylformamidase [Symbiobacteriaceae bacterium]